MNITYVIGNGFDLALGLHTSYEDFLKEFSKRDFKPGSYSAMLQNEIKEQGLKNWSDLELKFGQLTYSQKPIETFHAYLDVLQSAFATHLENEEDRFVLPKKDWHEIGERFCSDLLNIGRYMGHAKQERYYTFNSSSSLAMNFINFNYTRTLKDLCHVHKDRNNSFKAVLHGGVEKDVKVNEVCHVHGTLSKQDFVFGVDGEDQINDPEIKRYCVQNGFLIKPGADALDGTKNEERAIHILDNSNSVVLMGLSYGATDRFWWRKLYDMVLANRIHLIICPYFKKIEWTSLNKQKRRYLDIQCIRKVFENAIDTQKIDRITSKDMASRITVLDVSPVTERDGHDSFFDYFHLNEIGEKYIVPNKSELLQNMSSTSPRRSG